MKTMRLSGFVSYTAIALWFLLTIMAPVKARAETAVAITVSDILPSIEAALMEKGVTADAEIQLQTPDAVIYVAAGATPVFDSISVNPKSGRFLIRARGAEGTPSVAITGRAAASMQYPVLIQPVARGELISENHIAYSERNDLQAAFYVKDSANVIGMEARRPLQADTPLRLSDLKAPILVKRGALVTMIYANDGLRLTHHGVAAAAGGMGDVIAIENTKSDRTIKAVITGVNRASVIGSGRLAQSEL